MAGLIRREDVDAVRDRARIDEVVAAQVTLKPAGVGSLKGLCPFHDERTPSFHVRPGAGRWHCFGCGEGGDVISFIQRVDGLSFTEAVEYLASRVGITLRYEDEGTARPAHAPGRRQRLLEAHRVAAQFFSEQLLGPQAAAARAFLAERSFDRADAERFSVGFALAGWDNLQRHLQGRGFTQEELIASGLMSQGKRGIYDRFRGRLMWPIRDPSGDIIGFGARRLFEEDQGPKYLNTPETTLYKKSQVLYGIDLAKRDIARQKRIVVVEGYTDVMAAHLSGVTTAVATCGTAFGADHARVVRRLLGDTTAGGGVQLADGVSLGGEVIFTFDGDAAGQKAALRAFSEDQRFFAQTFVAVAPSGLDPCEVRMAHGPEAVRALVESRQPLFEFVIRSTLEEFDLTTAEGRVAALRATSPVIAGIRDTALRPEYARMLAGWLGMDEASVRRAVTAASRAPGAPVARSTATRSGVAQLPAVDMSDPVARMERDVLIAVLQQPHHVPAEFEQWTDVFSVAPWQQVHTAIQAAGGLCHAVSIPLEQWVSEVIATADATVGSLITALAVTPLPEDREAMIPDFVAGVVRALRDQQLARQIGDAKSALHRLDPTAPHYAQVWATLVELEHQRRILRESGH